MTQPEFELTPASQPQLIATKRLLIPAPGVGTVTVRLAPIVRRDSFTPVHWRHVDLDLDQQSGWFSLDLGRLNLADGEYEYDFVLDGDEQRPVADPYAEEITRFGGYRGVFRVRGGAIQRSRFNWEGELDAAHPLRANHELVVYELPMRWTSTESDVQDRQIGLGTFDHALFEHLPRIVASGFNAIELLPVQDSPDTLNWGYGTRFFFAPDYDMGGPIELKAFIKRCHQLGVRVILDVVMNHAKECPLERLAESWFFLRSPHEEGREFDWGGRCFRLATPAPGVRFLAREFLCDVARFWVSEYHVDGFRIDEFKGISNYDFVQEFTESAHHTHQSSFPERPFIVIAEDSARRAAVTQATHRGSRVVDAIWDFNQRDELRRALSDAIVTRWGEPSRKERVEATIRGHASWNDWEHTFHGGFGDLAQRVVYLTSHDVEKVGEQRLINYLLREELATRGWTDLSYVNIQRVIDGYENYTGPDAIDALDSAFERARSAWALLLTTPGIPMFLAGEEFADTHDTNHEEWRQKMSDVVNWSRRGLPRHHRLEQQVRELTALRTTCAALQRNETSFFYFHPSFDEPGGERVFGYCRTAGRGLYSDSQVVVVANLSRRCYPSFVLPWHWHVQREVAVSPQGAAALFAWGVADIPLLPGQVRVFTT
jgi:1,4-alpha-glucan branching enzyme